MGFPTVVVEAGFDPISSSTALVLDSATKGVLDVNTLAGQTWTDVSTYVQSFNTKRGASRIDGPILRYEAGTCTVVLYNDDRRFDPTNLSGPYVTGGVNTQVLPMLPIRVTATWAGVSYEIFSGYADDWDVQWFGYGDSMCTVTATDATKVLSNYDRVALGSGVGAGEDSGARVSRILDSVAWPSYARDVAVGDSTLQATTMDRSAWEELLLVQDSEIGEIYVDGGGSVVFHGRSQSLFGPTATTSQATFGDGVGELPFTTTAISYDDATIVNLVRISNVGGTQQIAEDTTSEAAYLVHTHDRSDLILQTDADAMSYAAFILYQAKDPELRFVSLGVNPHDDEDALFPQVLGRLFGDRITVIKRPPGWAAVGNALAADDASFEATIGGWTGVVFGYAAPTSLARSTVRAQDGTASLLITWATSATPTAGGTFVSGLSIGLTYMLSWYAYVPVGSPDVAPFVLGVVTGAFMTTKAAFTRVSVMFKATSTTHFVGVTAASSTSGNTCFVDAVQVDEGWAIGTFTTAPRASKAIVRDVLIRGVSHDIQAPNEWVTTFALQSASKFQAGAFILDHLTLGKLDVGVLI